VYVEFLHADTARVAAVRVSVCVYVRENVSERVCRGFASFDTMGWLPLVGSFKL